MTIRIGINGFGRIGRTYLRAALAGAADVEVVAVNDLTDAGTLATLLEWDSVAGHLDGVAADGEDLEVAGRTIKVFSEPDPAKIPWGEVGADVVIESTGFLSTGTRPPSTLRVVPRRSSSPHQPRVTSPPSSWGSTTVSWMSPPPTCSPTDRAPPTPWPRLPGSSTTPSGSRAVS